MEVKRNRKTLMGKKEKIERRWTKGKRNDGE